jgi:sugar O-acyltransferase (sialic acid O-acetyltransferase NeuD family)
VTALKDIVFWGSTGQARVLHEFLATAGYHLIALLDQDVDASSPFPNVPIYHGPEGLEAWLAAQPRKGIACAVAVGRPGQDRLRIQRQLEARGLIPTTLVHPTAYVARGVQLGAGSQVLAGSFVGVDARLGAACIVNSSASIDHECVLGDGVHVAPGATVTGCVHIGESAFIGAGAVILPRLRIGCLAVVGAGAVVTQDVPDGVVVTGNPARARKSKSVDSL